MVDVYLVGVGGQGIITASRIFGDAALLGGRNVVLSETHGMAQRGGSVICTARIGDVHSPLISDGKADIVLSFELLETFRAVPKMSRETTVLTSLEKIIPLSVSTQKLVYPSREDVRAHVSAITNKFVEIDAANLALTAGVPMSSNVVMVGALSGTGLTGLDREHFEKAVGAVIPRRLEENLMAFNLGYNAAKSALA